MKKRGEKFSLKGEYKKTWEYLKVSKNFILFIVGIFFLFALAGFFVPVPEIFSEKIFDYLTKLFEQTKGLSRFELINFIFWNNLKSSFFGILFGAFFGIFPVIGAIANGFVLGFVANLTTSAGGIFVLWRLFPHGIFELPAIFISLGLGLKLGSFVLQKKRADSFRNYLWNSLRVFLTVVFPLLIISAIIEGCLIFLLS